MAEYKPFIDICQNVDDTPSIYDQGAFHFPTRTVGVSTNPVDTRAVGVTTGQVVERIREDIPTDQAVNFGRSQDMVSNGGFGLDRKAVRGLERKEKIFLAVSLLNFIFTIALTIYRLVKLSRDNDTASPDFTFAILILVNSVFCMFYVVNGVFREDSYQLSVYIAAVCVVISYCTIEYSFRVEQRTTIKLVRLIVGATLGLTTIILAGFVIRDFGWIPFKRAGASEYLQRVYKETTRFFSLLVFDLQVAGCLAVLVLKNGTDVSIAEIVILATSIPLSIFLVIWGWKTVLKAKETSADTQVPEENRVLPNPETVVPTKSKLRAEIFVVVALLEPVYVIYKLVKIYKHVHSDVISLSDYLLYTQIFACFLAILVRALVYLEFHRVLNAPREANEEPSEETGLLRGQVGPARSPSYDIF